MLFFFGATMNLKFVLFINIVICYLGANARYFTRKWKPKNANEDKAFWQQIGQEELERVLSFQRNPKPAKNVILFLGDGMSIPTITASRIYKGQKSEGVSGEEGFLTFDRFPSVGLAKTYNVDKQVPDSASTGTAYLAGVKTNYKTIGVDATATLGDCDSVTEDNKVYSIAKWSIEEGKRAGIVTTTRVTHATPAATYAHVAHRDWECEIKLPSDCTSSKDIARQLVEDAPGNLFHVIMGGGYAALSSNWTVEPWHEMDQWDCFRMDGRNLAEEWLNSKGSNATVVRTLSEMNQIDHEHTDYVMGLFSNGHFPYDHQIKDLNLDIPTLKDMTETAIKSLQEEPNGFFLLVEGGLIDLAHHDTYPRRALDETVGMDLAIEAAMALVDLEETLIVVTADHTHTMMISGYPERGQDIIGFGGIGDDDLPYVTLMYANGEGFNDTYEVKDGKVARTDLNNVDVQDWTWARPSGFPRDSETHGGDDVAIYAIGPMSHLFNGVHEQNYIAHAMAYASCVGQNKDLCS